MILHDNHQFLNIIYFTLNSIFKLQSLSSHSNNLNTCWHMIKPIPSTLSPKTLQTTPLSPPNHSPKPCYTNRQSTATQITNSPELHKSDCTVLVSKTVRPTRILFYREWWHQRTSKDSARSQCETTAQRCLQSISSGRTLQRCQALLSVDVTSQSGDSYRGCHGFHDMKRTGNRAYQLTPRWSKPAGGVDVVPVVSTGQVRWRTRLGCTWCRCPT